MSNNSGDKYSYSRLSMASRDKKKLGMLWGYSVFAARKDELENLGTGALYIVYNDENMIVSRDGDTFYSLGKLFADGTIHEWNKRVYMTIMKKDFLVNESLQRGLDEIKAKTKEEESVEDIDVPDIQLHLLVEDTLKSARMLTIDDLLKGFNYGLV